MGRAVGIQALQTEVWSGCQLSLLPSLSHKCGRHIPHSGDDNRSRCCYHKAARLTQGEGGRVSS